VRPDHRYRAGRPIMGSSADVENSSDVWLPPISFVIVPDFFPKKLPAYAILICQGQTLCIVPNMAFIGPFPSTKPPEIWYATAQGK